MEHACHKSPSASFGKCRNIFRVDDALARCARRLWPRKAASELALRSGSTQRSAENWLAGNSSPSADHLAALLRSDAGLDLLCELMTSGCPPQWWAHLRTSMRINELERRAEETRLALQELKNENLKEGHSDVDGDIRR